MYISFYKIFIMWVLAHLHYKTLFSDIIMLDLMKNPVLSEVSKITNPLNEYFVKSFQ